MTTDPEPQTPASPDGPMQTPIRVLFLCGGNSARSQIAEALLTKKGRGRFVSASAGSTPAAAVWPEAIEELSQLGIDWSGHRPKGFDAVEGQLWDFIITLCDRTREMCPSVPGRPVYAHWSIPDPAAAEAADRPREFQNALQLLAWRIDLMLALRPELLDRAVIEERLRTLGTSSPAATEWTV